jgi:hypothetical protein
MKQSPDAYAAAMPLINWLLMGGQACPMATYNANVVKLLQKL